MERWKLYKEIAENRAEGKGAEIPAFTLVKIKGADYRKVALEIDKIASKYLFGIYHTTGAHDLVLAWSEGLGKDVFSDLIGQIEGVAGVEDTETGVTMSEEPSGVVSQVLPAKAMSEKEIKLVEQTAAKVADFLKKRFKTNEVVYPSDVASELRLDMDLVQKVFSKLLEEGKLRPG